MSTKKTGDKLEVELYKYFCDQRDRGTLVYDAYTPKLCKIHLKKKYYCKERENFIEFDVVIELFRRGGTEPHMYIVFECKNHARAIKESHINDFSDKVGRLFKHSSKAIIVVSSSLQSGAKNTAKNRGIGIIKFTHNGLEVTADRKDVVYIENDFVRRQFLQTENDIKSLKFAAYCDETFFSSVGQLLLFITGSESPSRNFSKPNKVIAVPYLSDEEIEKLSENLLKKNQLPRRPGRA